ncbi:hypothetical protein Q7C36_007044 [Tachysurus vachellii]|uniref:exodeoxyribonuclease III n=1 Tax=Tachysurus vachellii TaxID=175792 RepID=A0AA88NGL3_TACVA|nr:hypothetical protein Q7C36_007044 [Tachysurus vachellii]
MMSQGKTNLRFVTWNTRGIRNPDEKFSQVLQKLSDLQADIVFIQETRVGPKHYQILTEVEDWKVYFTVCRPSSKGVAILIKKTIPFEYICYDKDHCSGGYIVLFCHLYGELYTLVNVYNHKADNNVLGRLKEYLMETAEGVLVVGGDFNTVLHPRFDRSPDSKNSPFRSILENFTVSLHLRDTWSYLYFADEGFTRHQNESHSRLDMFFMHSDTMRRVCDIKVEENEISDHNPVVLELEVQKQTGNNFPKVSLLIEHLAWPTGKPNRISGKIRGAEILSAIKTLSDSEEQRPDQRQVEHYKSHQCPVTEILKIKYNRMLKRNFVSEAFKEYHLSQDRHIFNVEYLILSQILPKRLSAYIYPYTKEKQETNLATFLTMTCDKGVQKIKSSFLDKSLKPESEWKKKLWSSEPPTKFCILEHLLPEDQGSSGELRLLVPDCRLTNAILNLALNKLNYILNEETECRSSVCFQRQALLIHAHQSKQEKVVMLVEKFQEDSGIIFRRKIHTRD